MKEKLDKRAIRSEKYQWTIVETTWGYHNNTPIDYINEEGLYYGNIIPQLTAELNDLAFKRLYEVAEKCLTDRQFSVISNLLKGSTQMEVAKLLGVNQSSVNKSINGNISYEDGGFRHGGTTKKLSHNLIKDNEYRLIIKKLDELENGGKMFYLTRSFFVSQEDFMDWLDTDIHLPTGLPLWEFEMINDFYNRYFRTYRFQDLPKLYYTKNRYNLNRAITKPPFPPKDMALVYNYWKSQLKINNVIKIK